MGAVTSFPARRGGSPQVVEGARLIAARSPDRSTQPHAPSVSPLGCHLPMNGEEP